MSTAIRPMIQYGRDANGQAVLQAQNARNVNFNGVGIINGNGQLSLSSTDNTNDYTQITYSAQKDVENELVLGNNDGLHYNITGEEAYVTSMGGNAQRTIQVDSANSKIDLSNAMGAQTVYMSQISHDNKVILGAGSDYYIDEGKFNHVQDKGGSNTFVTTNNSHGAVIVGGAGADTFTISGSYSIIDGGNGDNVFNMMGIFGEQEDASYRNIVIGGNGNDTYNDKGGYNIFFAGGGSDTINLHGTKGIVDATDNNNETSGSYDSSLFESFIFTGEEVTYDGKTYNIYNIMENYGWTLNEFLNIYSRVSVENPASLGNRDVIDANTMAKLTEYFKNNLTKNQK